MLGLFGFIAEAKVPGSVPGLQFIKPYAGEIMAPFTEGDLNLPFVESMLATGKTLFQ